MHLTQPLFALTLGAGLVAASPLSWSEATFEEINALRARGIAEKDIARMHPMLSVPDHSHPVEALSFSEAYSNPSVRDDDESDVQTRRGLRSIMSHLCGGAWAMLGHHDEDAATKQEQMERLELRGMKEQAKVGTRGRALRG